MKKIVASVLMIYAGAGVAVADAQAPIAAAAANGPSISKAIKQLEHDLADAIRAGDVDKISQIVADDWTGIDYSGNNATKQSFLEDVKAGRDKVESVEFGPMDVKVLGNVAVVQGSDTEKSLTNGKDTSGKWVWMDVFAKREGAWVVVRSQSAMVQ
jgi:ketosteroid isomerase-like protein